MVSKSKSRNENASNPYTQTESKVKQKDVKDKRSSENIEFEPSAEKNESLKKGRNTDATADSVKENRPDQDSNAKEKPAAKEDQMTSGKKDASHKEAKVKESKDTKRKGDSKEPDQATKGDIPKAEDSNNKINTDTRKGKKEEVTSKSKSSSKQNIARESKENNLQQAPTHRKTMSSKASDAKPLEKKDHTDSRKTSKTATESEKESKATEDSEKESKAVTDGEKKPQEEESDSSEDSDSEEEESDEEEDPLIAQLASKYNLKVEEPEIQEKEEEERLLTAKSNVVDLKSLSLRYNAKNKSALQPVLVKYGLPDPYAGHEYQTEEKVRKKKKKSKSDNNDLLEKEKRGEQHGRVFENAQRLRELLSEDYMEKLQERVAQQRKDIQRRSDQLEQKILSMEQKKREKFERTLEKHVLTHDAAVLRAIPKSNAYKMVGLENKLKNKNRLRTQEDMDEFWSYAEDKLALKDYMRRHGLGRSKTTSPERQPPSHLDDSLSSSRTSSMSSITQEKEHTMDFTRTLTQIEETKEPSRPSTRDANAITPWAITQLSPAKHARRTQSPGKGSRSLSPTKTNVSISSSPTRKQQDPHLIAKQAAAELDKKHPMKELPPLNCFVVDTNEHTKDPEELLKELQYNRREKERKLFVKRIRSMYQRTKANVASTNRIMEKRDDDFTLDDEAPPTDTWLSSYDLEPVSVAPEPVHPDIQYMNDRPWLKHIRRRAIVTIVEESEPPSGVQSQKTSASIVRERPGSRDLLTRPSSIYSYQPEAVPALSMDTVKGNSKVIEAKCLSTLWTNYLAAGKSVFAS